MSKTKDSIQQERRGHTLDSRISRLKPIPTAVYDRTERNIKTMKQELEDYKNELLAEGGRYE